MYKNVKVNKLTIEQAKKEFITDRLTNGVSKRTLEGYNNDIDSFLKYAKIDAKTPIALFQKQWVNDYIVGRLDEVKPGSINVALRSIRAFLYWCMENEYMPRFKINLVKFQEEEQPVYSMEELQLLLTRPKDDFVEWRTYAAIAMMTSLGTRAGTLCSIETANVNFKENEITYKQLKNKRLAVLPLSPQLAIILDEFVNKFDRDTKYLFSDVNGGQLTVGALRQSIIKYCVKKGVKYKGVHSFRRSFAKYYILNGGNTFMLQRMLTHSTVAMSAHYVNLYGSDLKNNFEKLSPLDTIQLR